MPLHYPKANHNHVSEYQVAGIPFVTQSASTEVGTTNSVRVDFPYVTQWIQIQNIGANRLRFAFTDNGARHNDTNNNSFILNASSGSAASAEDIALSRTDVLKLRCKSLFFLGLNDTTGFQVIAGLTNVKSREFIALTGSDGFVGVG